MRFKHHRKRTDPLQTENKPFFVPNRKIQSKEESQPPGIRISSPGDKSEKQADAVADRVVSNSDKSLQYQSQNEEIGFVQKAAGKEEEKDKTSTKSEMRKAKEEEKDTVSKVQVKEEEKEKTSAKLEVQRKKEEEKDTNPKKEEEENETQGKSKIQRKNDSVPIPSFENRTKAAKMGGTPLPEKVRKEMESMLKFNFNKVRIHTDDEAVKLCSEIKAQAFTNGYHIFFNKGKFNPETSSGKRLLAHELTHIIQQKG